MVNTVMVFVVALATTILPQQESARSAVLRALKTGTLHQRVSAVTDLRNLAASDRTVLLDGAVVQAVTQTLEDANADIFDSYATHQASSFTDGWSEAYSELLGFALEVAEAQEQTNERLVSALVNGSYNGDSPFATRLGAFGETAALPALAAAKSPLSPRRGSAYGVLGSALAGDRDGKCRAPLSEATRSAAVRELTNGLQNEETQIDAVQSLRHAARPEALGPLRDLEKRFGPQTPGVLRDLTRQAIAATEAGSSKK